jgi:hypothetical protein
MRRSLRPSLATLSAVALVPLVTLAAAPAARAQDAKTACRDAYEQAQLLRREGKPHASKGQLEACARAECSDAVRADCVKWLDEVERSVPTVVLEAHTESGDPQAVRVTMDGTLLAERIDGKPIEVEPGPHAFRFELAGRPPVDVNVVVFEGQKDRAVAARWAPPQPPPGTPGPGSPSPLEPPAPPVPLAPLEPAGELPRPIPAAAWIAGGVGVAGLAAFATLAAVGTAKKNELDTTCSPLCTPGDLAPARTAFAAADVSLAVGLVAVGVATTLVLTRPARRTHAAVVDLRQGGAVVGFAAAW